MERKIKVSKLIYMKYLIILFLLIGCSKQAKHIPEQSKGKKHQSELALLADVVVTVSGNTLSWTLPDNPKWTFVQKSPTLPVGGDSTTTAISFYQVQWKPNYVTSVVVASGFFYRVCGSDILDDIYLSNTVFVP